MAVITWICWILGSLFLGLGGLWFARAVFWDRARGRRRCPKCWYDMAGVPGLTCPECGKKIAAERLLSRTRRHWRQAMGALVVVLVGYLGARLPDVISDGLATVVPTIPLRIVVSMFDEFSTEPSLPAPPVPASPNFGVTGSQIFFQPQFPAVQSAPKTWLERTELNWKDLQRASRARKTIYKAIRLAEAEPESVLAQSHLKSARNELDRLSVESKIAIDAVRALVNRDELPEKLRHIGIQTLIDMGDNVQGAKRTLRRVVRSDRQEVGLRLAALEGLVSLGDAPSEFRSGLRNLLSTADWWDRFYKRTSVRAARIVMGLPDPAAITELTNAFRAGDSVTRSAIRYAIDTSYSNTPVINAMREFLRTEYATSTRTSIEALSHSDLVIRMIAARELRELPPIDSADGERCLDAIERSRNPDEQRYLIELVRKQQIKGDRVNALLRGRVGVEGAIDLGYSALHAANEVCPEEIAVEIAIYSLNDPYPHTRYLAAWILRQRAEASASALPALRRVLDDEFGSVQKAAFEAIEMIEDAVREQQGQSSEQSSPIGGP